jgi:hypothetical protein
MKTLTLVCNIASLLFTCFVLGTDGAPKEAVYIVFTLLLLLIPIFTVFALVRGGAGQGPGRAIQRAAAICNVVLLGSICWVLVKQYPHPSEPGFIEYAVLILLTPILSAVVLLVSACSDRGRSRQLDIKAPEGQAG